MACFIAGVQAELLRFECDHPRSLGRSTSKRTQRGDAGIGASERRAGLYAEKNLTPALAACLADANSYYVLGFDSAPAAVPDEFRAIEITVDRPSATVRTNTEYYAQP